MRPLRLIATCSATVLLLGCTGSKPMAKKAGKLDQAGMYAEAADMYMQSLQRNGSNVDAKIGLKKTGQMVLNERMGDFFKAYNMGSARKEAVQTYLDGRAYFERVQRLGVQLDIPDHYRRDFDLVKGEYVVELYERGQEQLDRQDFKGAEMTFSEIAKLEPNYKDASSLQAVAFLEPLYRAGKADLEAGRYRKAYDELDRVVSKDAGYKDAAALRQEALRLGQFTVAVLPFTATNGRNDAAGRVQAYAMTALSATKDPFLRLVDRENMDRILAEQRLSMSGVVDEQTAVRVGNLMGAQAVLMGEVIDLREEPGQVRRSTKDGFESYRVEQINKETGEKSFVTRYRPVKYSEFYQENKVRLSFSYRLVSLETGEVLVTRVVDHEAQDHIYYATYDGNRDALLPSKQGIADNSDRARRDLRGLLGAPREVKPVSQLANDLLNTTTSTMATTIQQELKTRLP